MEARHPPGCYGTDSVFTSTLMAGKCEAQVMSLLETAKRNCLRLHTPSLTRTKNKVDFPKHYSHNDVPS